MVPLGAISWFMSIIGPRETHDYRDYNRVPGKTVHGGHTRKWTSLTQRRETHAPLIVRTMTQMSSCVQSVGGDGGGLFLIRLYPGSQCVPVTA